MKFKVNKTKQLDKKRLKEEMQWDYSRSVFIHWTEPINWDREIN